MYPNQIVKIPSTSQNQPQNHLPFLTRHSPFSLLTPMNLNVSTLTSSSSSPPSFFSSCQESATATVTDDPAIREAALPDNLEQASPLCQQVWVDYNPAILLSAWADGNGRSSSSSLLVSQVGCSLELVKHFGRAEAELYCWSSAQLRPICGSASGGPIMICLFK